MTRAVDGAKLELKYIHIGINGKHILLFVSVTITILGVFTRDASSPGRMVRTS